MAGGNTGLPSGLDLITETLAILGVAAPGEALAAADAQSAFFTLQGILDGWGAELLTIYRALIMNFTTTAGKSTYLLGPAGATPANDWITNSLPTVFYDYGQLVGSPTPVEIPLAEYTDKDWAAIGIKTMQSTYLEGCWPVYGPLAHSLSFWPVPSAAIPIVLYTNQQVSKLSAISDVIALPPGYQEALTYELVIKLSSKFARPVPDWIPSAWQEAKSKIKQANFQPIDVSFDPALSSDSGWFSGGGSIGFYEGK